MVATVPLELWSGVVSTARHSFGSFIEWFVNLNRRRRFALPAPSLRACSLIVS